MSTSVAKSDGKPFPSNFYSLLLENLGSSKECFYFLVGSKKKQIIRIPEQNLLRQSELFRIIYQTKLDYVIVTREEDKIKENLILLPNVDPDIFKNFTKMISERNVSQALNNLKLPVQKLLELVQISKAFDVPSIQNITENWICRLLKKTPGYLKSKEFYDLNRYHVETLFSSEWISLKEVEIYSTACQWAVIQCDKENVARTSDNLRRILGKCIFEIRFPLMNPKEFCEVVRPQGLLSNEEKTTILNYITRRNNDWDEKEKNTFALPVRKLGFKTEGRNGPSSWPPEFFMEFSSDTQSTLSKEAKTDSDRQYKFFAVQVNRPRLLTGVGFAGPAMSGGFVNARIQPFLWIDDRWKPCGVTVKETKEKVGKITRIQLDKPVQINPVENQPFRDSATIKYSLKRPRNIYEPVYFGQADKSTYLQTVENMRFLEGGCNELVELFFAQSNNEALSKPTIVKRLRSAIRTFFTRCNCKACIKRI